MTSITLNVTGAKAQAVVNGFLTSGMVGIPVTIHCDNAWNGLTKNFVCRCGKWMSDRGETRTVLGIDETATVAHEVMQANKRLYLGVEGYSTDGKLVIPTTWADCGVILHGANAGADPSTDPELSVWAQLQAEIEQIKQNLVTEEEIAAAVAAYMEENPIEIPGSSQDTDGLSDTAETLLISILRSGVYSTDQSANINALEIEFASGGSDGGDTHTHSYTASVTTAATCTTAGVKTYTCECGENCTESIPATGHNYVDRVCSVCGAADPNYSEDVTLTSISTTYSGGDVTVGTAVTDLVGIVVTAHYSDGSSRAVTGYTLSGEIAEGENIITVTYAGMTATFTVTGVAESGSGDGTVVDAWTSYEWTEGIHLSGSSGNSAVENENANYVVSDYISTENVEKIIVTEEIGGNLGGYAVYWFDSNKLLAKPKNTAGYIRKDNDNYPSPVEITIPDTAAYFRIDSSKDYVDGSNASTLVKYSIYFK